MDALDLAEVYTAKELPAALKGTLPKHKARTVKLRLYPKAIRQVRGRPARKRRSATEDGTRLVRYGARLVEGAGALAEVDYRHLSRRGVGRSATFFWEKINVEASHSIKLAAEIVAAYVSNNPIPTSELPALIEAVQIAVAKLATPSESVLSHVEAKAPAVPVRKSVTPDYVICLEDGKKFKSMRASPDATRADAGTVSREMEPAVRLSHGCTQLRGAAVGYGEKDRPRSDSPQGGQGRYPADVTRF